MGEIERMTDECLQEDRAELKAMSAKLRLTGNDEGLQRSIAGKKRMIRGEGRKVVLLHELLKAKAGTRLVLASSEQDYIPDT